MEIRGGFRQLVEKWTWYFHDMSNETTGIYNYFRSVSRVIMFVISGTRMQTALLLRSNYV